MQKKKVVAAMAALIITMAGCESVGRSVKSIESDFGGGLNRTVTVFSNTGEQIKSWSGKFDVSNSETETWFDLNGKRVIIHGGIVIDEEQ